MAWEVAERVCVIASIGAASKEDDNTSIVTCIVTESPRSDLSHLLRVGRGGREYTGVENWLTDSASCSARAVRIYELKAFDTSLTALNPWSLKLIVTFSGYEDGKRGVGKGVGI